jgi:hypothetical protein
LAGSIYVGQHYYKLFPLDLTFQLPAVMDEATIAASRGM